MSCFLCAYGRKRVPKDPDKPASLTPPPETLGTCRRCSVHACSRHGARVGQFLCAICEGADVTQSTLAPGSIPVTAMSGGPIPKAKAVGAAAPADLRETVRKALALIDEAGSQRPDRAERLDFALPGAGPPNLVFNLSESIRELAGGGADFAIGGEGPENVEEEFFDAVGGVVRELFAEQEIVVTDESVPVVTGALLIAVQVAHDSDDALEAALLAPWQMSDPLLLDPVMWMVSTAVRQVTMGTPVLA
jgi:hypothetical protein